MFLLLTIALVVFVSCNDVGANNKVVPGAKTISAAEPSPGTELDAGPSSDQPSAPAISAVPTFESIGLYWRRTNSRKGDECDVRYRPSGEENWKVGLPLWFDDRNQECRGSLVNLRSNTTYEIELSLKGSDEKKTVSATTWSETFPIAENVSLPEQSDIPLWITRSGTPDGYVVYAPQPGKAATIDVDGRYDANINIDASYVIVRGLTLKNAARNAINISAGSHDVVIEDNDISGWGGVAPDGWGEDLHAAIATSRGDNSRVVRLVIQRNKMHHPRSNANAWDELRPDTGSHHPAGPQATMLWNTGGNHVIRYNEIYTDDDHKFNDCIGGGENFSDEGSPNKDSDIYGNYISGCWDDGIESEGANSNVRIWGNFIDLSYVMIAVTPTQIGPVYIWRNVADRSRRSATTSMADSKRGVFLKTQNKTVRGRFYGGGRIYVFHNTLLQRQDEDQGVYSGLNDLGSEMLNIVSRNNILQVNADYRYSIYDSAESETNDFDYDLYNGRIYAYQGSEKNGIEGTPQFGPTGPLGPFYLLPSSPGRDQGVVIPNFNDDYQGAAPDMGAYEAGSTTLQFGTSSNRTTRSCRSSTRLCSPSAATANP